MLWFLGAGGTCTHPNQVMQKPSAITHRETGGILDAYAPHEDVPLYGYTVALAGFSVAFAATIVQLRRRHARRLGIGDIALLGIGTHKLGRIVAKDFVTAPLRAPFTRRAEAEGGGEVHDEPRGGPIRETLGNLLSCPYCLGPWLAAGLGTALALRPRETRFVLSTLTAVTISDFLHQRYAKLNEGRKLTLAQRRQAEQGQP